MYSPLCHLLFQHLHIHVVPQVKTVIQELQGYEQSPARRIKGRGEMEEETSQLRHVVTQILPDFSEDAYDIPK